MTEISSYEQQALDFLASTGTTFKAEFQEYNYHFSEDKEKRNIFKITLSNERHKYSFKFGSSINDSTIETKKKQIEVADTIEIYAGLNFTERGFCVGRSFVIHKKDDFALPFEGVEKLAIEMQNEYFTKASAKNKQWIEKFKSGVISRNYMELKMVNAKPAIGMFEQAITRAITRECEKLVSFNIEATEKIAPKAYDVLSCLTKYEVGTFENFCGDYGYDSDSRKAYKVYKAVLKEWKNIELLFTPDQLEQLQEIN